VIAGAEAQFRIEIAKPTKQIAEAVAVIARKPVARHAFL